MVAVAMELCVYRIFLGPQHLIVSGKELNFCAERENSIAQTEPKGIKCI